VSSYRDLDGETPDESRQVADDVGAPTPVDPEAPRAADRVAVAGTPDASPPRHVTVLGVGVVVVAALVLAFIAVRVLHQLAPTASTPAAVSTFTPVSAVPSSTSSPAAAPSAAPATPGTPPATASAAPQPPGDTPEPTAIPDGGTAALAAARAFLPAWTMAADPSLRRVALAKVASARLVDELAGVDPAQLPAITGAPTLRQGSPSVAVIAVPSSAGTALLTVQPAGGRWLVTEVSLDTTTPAAAHAATVARTPAAAA